MVPVSMGTEDGLGDYLRVTLRWWGYPSMCNLLEFEQSPRKSFFGSKNFGVKMAICPYFTSYLAMPKLAKT